MSLLRSRQRSALVSPLIVLFNREAHNNSMLRAPGYNVPDDATRIRKIFHGIKSENPLVLAAVASVKTNPALRHDFDDAVDVL